MKSCRQILAKAVLAVSILALLSAALPCRASDVAVLRNGFSIRHERRQVIGTTTRLFIDGGNSSFVDIPTVEIDHFEALPPETATPEPARNNAAAQARVGMSAKNVMPPVDLNEVVRTASGTYSLDPDLVNSVIRAESGFNVRAVSPKGAQGLMQLMPQTASQLGVQNAFDAEANVNGGTRYLRELLERYNFDLIKALAAYNAGPQRVEQYGGVPPYYETKAYVARIVRDFNKKKLAARNASQPVAQKSASKKISAASSPAAKTHKPGTQTQAKANPSSATAAN
jgi:Transglycosylase SLT domain